jgi:hypothetical protein
MDGKTIKVLETCHDLETRGSSGLAKPGRDIAALAGIQIVCFLVLTRFEPRFFIIHLYQMVPYAAILLLVGYSLLRWAYAIGALVSILWLGLAYEAGLLGSAVERLRIPANSDTAANLVAVLALVTGVVAVLMTVLCRVHWVKGDSQSRANRRVFLLSLAMVCAYYLVLAHWFWDMIRDV